MLQWTLGGGHGPCRGRRGVIYWGGGGSLNVLHMHGGHQGEAVGPLGGGGGVRYWEGGILL